VKLSKTISLKLHNIRYSTFALRAEESKNRNCMLDFIYFPLSPSSSSSSWSSVPRSDHLREKGVGILPPLRDSLFESSGTAGVLFFGLCKWDMIWIAHKIHKILLKPSKNYPNIWLLHPAEKMSMVDLAPLHNGRFWERNIPSVL